MDDDEVSKKRDLMREYEVDEKEYK